MKKYLIFFFLLLLPIKVNAATDRGMLICDKTTFNEYAHFVCRISVETKFAFDKIELTITPSPGLYLEEVRSNYDALWEVSTKDNVITATTKRKRFVSNLQEFAILLIGAESSGKQEIKITDMILSNSGNSKTKVIKEFKEEVTILSSENKLKGIFIDTKIIPGFNMLVAGYHLEINKNQTSLALAAIPLEENAKINGVGEINLDSSLNEFVLPIDVTSASGVIKNYYLILNRAEDTNQIMVDDIILTDNFKNNVNLKFKSHVYEYNVEVANNIKTLDLNVKINNSKLSLVKNYGSRKIDLHNGDNLVLIKVKDETGQIKHYIINITRVLSDKSANCFLKNLVIAGYDLRFNKKVKQYSLAIKASDKKLNIAAKPDHQGAEVTIMGNDNLKENSIIKIIVTAENGSRMTYQITTSYQKFNYKNLLIVLVTLSGIIIVVRKFYRQRIIKAEALRLAEEKKKIEAAAISQKPKAKKSPTKKAGTKKSVATKKTNPQKSNLKTSSNTKTKKSGAKKSNQKSKK